jgi:hypothetical protein
MDKPIKKPTLEIIEEGLRGNIIDNLVDGWYFSIEEVSSHFYRIDGVDKKGYHISNFGIDPINVLNITVMSAKKIASREKFFTKMKIWITKVLRYKKLQLLTIGITNVITKKTDCPVLPGQKYCRGTIYRAPTKLVSTPRTGAFYFSLKTPSP